MLLADTNGDQIQNLGAVLLFVVACAVVCIPCYPLTLVMLLLGACTGKKESLFASAFEIALRQFRTTIFAAAKIFILAAIIGLIVSVVNAAWKLLTGSDIISINGGVVDFVPFIACLAFIVISLTAYIVALRGGVWWIDNKSTDDN